MQKNRYCLFIQALPQFCRQNNNNNKRELNEPQVPAGYLQKKIGEQNLENPGKLQEILKKTQEIRNLVYNIFNCKLPLSGSLFWIGKTLESVFCTVCM